MQVLHGRERRCIPLCSGRCWRSPRQRSPTQMRPLQPASQRSPGSDEPARSAARFAVVYITAAHHRCSPLNEKQKTRVFVQCMLCFTVLMDVAEGAENCTLLIHLGMTCLQTCSYYYDSACASTPCNMRHACRQPQVMSASLDDVSAEPLLQAAAWAGLDA